MRIWRSLQEVPADLGRTVVTVGNFDGVHLGHQHVISRAREVAAGLDTEQLVAVTFDPHPIAVLRPEHAPPTLTTVESRNELLGAAGVDDVLVMPFTREIADWSPERFVKEILVDALHANAVVVGVNFRFGSKAAGDVTTLRELGERYDFVTEGIALDGGPQVWSSTYVRNCLAGGDVEGAAEALGRPYSVRGVVVEGDKRGRELGFPTANVPTAGIRAVPADGVYAGRVWRLDEWGRTVPGEPLGTAAISVGTNPTFGIGDRTVEAYALDRDDLDLYGVHAAIDFTARLRGTERFDSVQALITQMHADVAQARALTADHSEA